jgi:hypothetical protein
VGLVGKARERGAPGRTHDRHVVAEPAHLILHQLRVLGRQAVLVAVEQVAKLDVVKARVIALGARRQIDADRAAGGAPQPRREDKEGLQRAVLGHSTILNA